jgi:hypothetical protein
MSENTDTNIEQAILDSNLEEICDTTTGDCASVAVAIQQIYGGEIIVAYTTDESGNIVLGHCLVEINGVCYDGNGVYMLDKILELARDEEAFERDEDVFEYVDNASELDIYDESVKERVKERILDCSA